MFAGFGTSFIEGSWITIQLAFCALFIGLVIGVVGAIAKMSNSKVLRSLASIYTTLIRSIPELLVIFLAYYGGTLVLSKIFDRYIEVNAFYAGVFALSFIFGAYATESFRAAFLAIPKGQVEAAKAYGFSAWQCFYRVQLPQLWRVAIPSLGNLWLVLLKETSLISIVGLEDIMRKAQIATGATNKPFTFYVLAALIYLCMTIVSTIVIKQATKYVNRPYQEARI